MKSPPLCLLLAAMACTSADKTIDSGEPDTGSGNNTPTAWGEIHNEPAATFFASDLPDSVREGVNAGLAAAADVWGNYGPLEYWVLGLSHEAALVLINEFCHRRDAAGDFPVEPCMAHQTAEGQDHNMMSYHLLSVRALEDNIPMGSMGRNGNREWGIHLFTSSYPWGFGDVFDYVSAEEETKTLFHEYFHAVQHAHIQSMDFEERDELLGPTWFVEGGAEYMAVYATSKGWAEGSLNTPANANPTAFSQQMEWKLDGGLQNRAENCPEKGLGEIGYADTCSYAAYELGAWGIAYLHSITTENQLVDVFYPQLESLGFEAAFEASFGLTLAQFHTDFEAFLALPKVEQMAILPTF